jgi:hypothetical protein
VRRADWANRGLELRGADPVDCARTTQVFPALKHGIIRFKLLARQNDRGRLAIQVRDRRGDRPPIRDYAPAPARARLHAASPPSRGASPLSSAAVLSTPDCACSFIRHWD